jgi:multiple sugar transport system ATP-binding protein
MAEVLIREVEKHYGAVKVLHDIDLDISSGEFVVLVGPSGCGKSTLLRMIAGLEEITGGSISIDERVVNEVKPKDRDIAMVFQNYALYPQMTVAQNMGFSLEMQRLGKEEISRKVQEAAEILNLTELLHRKPAQLSGGQRQRVSMGRAIVRNPKVFLFDEPLSNLDAKLRVQMRAEIKSLHARLGSTVVYVTHDQVEAMTMADKIVVMNQGRIEQIGSPLELYDQPINAFVAGFLGSPAMNFFEARYGKGGFTISEEVFLPYQHELREGRPVTIGIRPEKLRIENEGPLRGKTVIVEPTGSETILGIDIGGNTATVVAHSRLEITANSLVGLNVDPSDIYLFDADTGAVIQ